MVLVHFGIFLGIVFSLKRPTFDGGSSLDALEISNKIDFLGPIYTLQNIWGRGGYKYFGLFVPEPPPSQKRADCVTLEGWF